MLELKIARNSPFEKEAILVKDALASLCESIALNSHFVLHVNEEIYLSLENSEISEKDFKIDVFNEKLLWRLNHSGKTVKLFAVLSSENSQNQWYLMLQQD